MLSFLLCISAPLLGKGLRGVPPPSGTLAPLRAGYPREGYKVRVIPKLSFTYSKCVQEQSVGARWTVLETVLPPRLSSPGYSVQLRSFLELFLSPTT